jgi:DNA-binding beta-propeller fold protein YncE
MFRRALLVFVIGCTPSKPLPPPNAPDGVVPAGLPRTIALPGAPADGVFLDYLAYDPKNHRVWVPAGGTGRVDVIDARNGILTAIEGFPTKEMERRGQKRLVGPTSATVGDTMVYIGNRGDSSVCAIDAATLAKQGCATLDAMPDGLQYIASTKEVWVTTPRDQSIRILDVTDPAHPTAKGSIKFEGEPEGFAVDNARGLFFTNLEDKDKTLVVDLKSHAVTKTWEPKCGEDGPKGLIYDDASDHLLVVCPALVETFDHDGKVLSKLEVGDGLDAVDFVPGRREVFAAAARAEKMTVARLDTDGKLTALTTVPTAKGARNAVASEDGTAFVANGPAGAILVVKAVTK